MGFEKKETDKYFYERLKRLNENYPGRFFDAKQWKKERLEELEKEGKEWTK